MTTAPLLAINGVTRRFGPALTAGDRIAKWFGASVETRAVQAVSDVSLSIQPGEVLGLVGESGCGKSTLGRIAAGILPPSEGTVTLAGEPVFTNGRKTTTRIQTVFQDPFASLDPRMRVGDAIAEGPLSHGLVRKADAPGYVAEWLGRMGLDNSYADRLPHQFSGGQRQRIAIARALAMKPDVLICDEPVASLDVSIQAQILNLFLKLRHDLGLTMLFISHDLSVVRHVSDRIAVMYLGQIVEIADAETVHTGPAHPYTKGLLQSVPRLNTSGETVTFTPILGEIPSPLAPPPGCRFNPRCPIAEAACQRETPALRSVGSGHEARCLLA